MSEARKCDRCHEFYEIPKEQQDRCETCRYYNNNTYWCSQYNDTTYRPNCSSYKVKMAKEALNLAGEYKKENEEMKRLLKLISEETDCLATFRYADKIEKLIGE